MISYSGWVQGAPDAKAAGVLWLRRAQAFRPDLNDETVAAHVRDAVARQQKRWRATPTGALSLVQWDRLRAEFDTDDDVDDPQTVDETIPVADVTVEEEQEVAS